jgi:phosphoribosyl-ATP pyrophosphohydrolase|tara:strand:+ start:1653 stop:1967 length:315 start_codon:yes stop_codon:yes gene_type:complete
MNMLKPLEELVKIIRERKFEKVDNSYTKQLLNNKKLCTEKVKEELKELLDAIKLEEKFKNAEAADLLYHLFVFLEANNIKVEEIMKELKTRQQKSGLEEKLNRN